MAKSNKEDKQKKDASNQDSTDLPSLIETESKDAKDIHQKSPKDSAQKVNLPSNLIIVAIIAIAAFVVFVLILVLPSSTWLVAVFVILLLLLFIWQIPKWQTIHLKKSKGGENQSAFDLEKERIKLQDDIRKTLAQIIGGILFLVGLGFTYQTFELNRQSQDLTRETIEISRKTIEVGQEGQLTERFSKATELLGNEDRSVRLGGLYALERIAKDSPKDHSTVMEVLAAYIRVKSVEHLKNSNDETTSWDIKAAFEIIKRRNKENDSVSFSLDLSRADLRGLDLVGMNLSNAELGYANLKYSLSMNTNFSGAVLVNTNFAESNLMNANFEGASVSNTKLRK